MSPEQVRARAYAARALTEDATIKAGWDALEADLIGQWERSGTSWSPFARRKREGIWIELKHLRNLRIKLAHFAGMARE